MKPTVFQWSSLSGCVCAVSSCSVLHICKRYNYLHVLTCFRRAVVANISVVFPLSSHSFLKLQMTLTGYVVFPVSILLQWLASSQTVIYTLWHFQKVQWLHYIQLWTGRAMALPASRQKIFQSVMCLTDCLSQVGKFHKDNSEPTSSQTWQYRVNVEREWTRAVAYVTVKRHYSISHSLSLTSYSNIAVLQTNRLQNTFVAQSRLAFQRCQFRRNWDVIGIV